MDTLDFTTHMKRAKKEMKDRIRRIAYTKMFLDANSDLFPEEWNLTMWFPGYLRLSAPEGTQLPDFVKVADRIAKKMLVEPDNTIGEDHVEYTFKVWLGEYSKTFGSSRGMQCVNLEVTTKNTEGCEVTYKRKMHKIPVLTGYCKEISEQKLLSHA